MTDASGYAVLAEYYDRLMADVPYSRWVKFISVFADKIPKSQVKIIDAGCGTGTISVALSQRGYCVTGLDSSPEMLMAAENKAKNLRLSINWVEQSIVNLDAEADMIICTCDGINHLISLKNLAAFFLRASQCLGRNGYLIFDINSPYKFRNLLSDNTFAWGVSGLDIVWSNLYSPPINRAVLTLYRQQINGTYLKIMCEIIERCYALETLLYYLCRCRFRVIGMWDNYGKRLEGLNVSRITVVAQKK